MIGVDGSGYVGEFYYDKVAYLPAKWCDFNKDNFEKVAKEELGDIKIITEVQEQYYRCVKADEYYDLGEYCYKPCKKGKGATLYYYAGYEE